MITVTDKGNGFIYVKANYYYRDRLSKIYTAKYIQESKEWCMVKQAALDELLNEFEGELVFKTPLWVMKNLPMPDMSQMYKINNASIKAPQLKCNLYDYQDYGVRFMIDKLLQNGFVINADDVGLGKTIQSIGTLKWFIDNVNVNKILIICKRSIRKQWKQEINKFTDLSNDFSIEIAAGTPKQRKKSYEIFQNANKGILITNYHTFLNDTDYISQLGAEFVIIDEVHSIKARTGKLNNNIAKVVKGKPTIFLTGTPIMSRPEDIFGIVQIANPKYFGKWKDFSDHYLVYTTGIYGIQCVGAKHLDELRNKVQNIVIRRTEYEVSLSLPKTQIIKIDCLMDKTQEDIIIKISNNQEKILDELKSLKVNGVIPPYNQDKADKLEALSKALIAARQAAATDPRLFKSSPSSMMQKEYGVLVDSKYSKSSKIESIIDIVEDITANGYKVILFTKFKTCAVLVASDIHQATKENVLLYTGAEDDTQRDDAIYKFQNTSDYNIIIGTEAMSEGINLQMARYVINIDQPDTFAIKTQRIGRVRRVGSKYNNVIVYDMITESTEKAKSKDEERLENIANNMDLTDALVSIDEAQRQALIAVMKQN